MTTTVAMTERVENVEGSMSEFRADIVSKMSDAFQKIAELGVTDGAQLLFLALNEEYSSTCLFNL